MNVIVRNRKRNFDCSFKSLVIGNLFAVKLNGVFLAFFVIHCGENSELIVCTEIGYLGIKFFVVI